MVHSGAKGVGENLAQMGADVKGDAPVKMWYGENSQYNYANGGFSLGTGHFTQLVWKGSKKLGIGIGYTSDRRKSYIVARYSPPGNYGGQYQQNVSPAKC